MKRYFLLILLLVTLLCGCNITSLDNSTNKPNFNDGNSNNQQEGNNNETNKYNLTTPNFTTRKISSIDEITLDDFFNLGNRVDISVMIKEAELKKLQADYETGYKSEIYRFADKVEITLTNYGIEYKWEYANVGIRQKGNTSRNNIISSDGNLNLNHYKLSFDETFDDPEMYDSSFIESYGNAANKDREFLGMSGLDFKWNKNYDQTHIREVFANYLYRASGIIVQHSGLSNFTITNTDNNISKSMGLCTVYEPATKSLLKRSLKSDDKFINMSDWKTEKNGTYGIKDVNYGDLYKCIWGADLSKNSISGSNIGIGNISGSYIPIYERKTNTDIEYNDKLLRNAVEAISSGNYDSISQYVDLEYLAICEAVGYVVGNPDSMRYNMNNYMIYMRKTDGKMIFIPIDTDRCFGITKDWNPKDGYMYTSMLDRKNSNNNDTISLLLNTILAKSSNESQELYLEFCNKIKESEWMNIDTFNRYFDMAKSSYSEHYFSLTDSKDNITFETYINNKMQQITSNSDTGSSDNIKYDNLYIVGTFNDWGNYSSSELNKYKMNMIADNTYSISVKITKGVNTDDRGSYIKFKFNNGYNNYDQIDWKLSEDLKTLITDCNDSQFCYGVNIGDTLTVTINTITLEAIVVIN